MGRAKGSLDDLFEVYLCQLAAKLTGAGEEDRPVYKELRAGRRVLYVGSRPEYELPAGLTLCERDIVRILTGQSQRLTTQAILAEKERRWAAGQMRRHGDSTVRLALTHLVHLEVITSQRHAPSGYALAPRYCRQAAAC